MNLKIEDILKECNFEVKVSFPVILCYHSEWDSNPDEWFVENKQINPLSYYKFSNYQIEKSKINNVSIDNNIYFNNYIHRLYILF